jgi:hypothetical protein
MSAGYADRSRRYAEPVLAGTLAVSLGLAAGRWGSYLGRYPIFLTDVLVAAACAHLMLRGIRSARAGAPRRKARTGPFLLLAGWSLFRLAIGGDVGLVALRDAVPYLYAVLGVVSGVALVRSTRAQRERTARVFVWALTFHTVWVFLALIVRPSLPDRLPLLDPAHHIHVLTVRPDFDAAILGVYAAYLISIAFRKGWSLALLPIAAGIAMAWDAIFATGSRAGLIGAAIPTVAVVATSARQWIPARTRMAIVGLVLIVLVAFAFVLPAGQRLLSSVGVTSPWASEATAAQVAGTTHARELAWSTVVHYSLADPGRFVAGVGFGPDFMSQSGALSELIGPYEASGRGDPPTRSPHSWWLGTQARLGIIGLVMIVALLVMLVRRLAMLRTESTSSEEPLLWLSGLVVLALIVPLSVGVIMESPFGAVPFFWCSGVILNHPLGVAGERWHDRDHPPDGAGRTGLQQHFHLRARARAARSRRRRERSRSLW